DDEDETVRHIQVVAGNRSINGAAQSFRIEAVDVDGLDEPITLCVDLGESTKSVDDLLVAGQTGSKGGSRSAEARARRLDILQGEGDQESDALDKRVANETGLSARTVQAVRVGLAREGLIKNYPDRDEHGSVVRWNVGRTQAPR